MNLPKKRLLDQVRETMRVRRMSLFTEKSYVNWIRQYIRFHGLRHPRELGSKHVGQFITHLAIGKNVAAGTQNQALNALVFLYKHVIKSDLGHIHALRARKERRYPTVLSKHETADLLGHIKGTKRLIAELLYGTGMRLAEALSLRVKDLDFAKGIIIIRDAKGGKDRTVPFPKSLVEPLRIHLVKVHSLHSQDIKAGFGSVYLPHALATKYPKAERDFGWQYVFPGKNISRDPISGIRRRHHLYDSIMQGVIKAAAIKAGISKHVSCHALRHSFATHLIESGIDIRTVQSLLGHSDVKTTMICTHVAEDRARCIKSPLDEIRLPNNSSDEREAVNERESTFAKSYLSAPEADDLKVGLFALTTT